MAAAAPEMPTDPLGARVYMRNVLEEVCLRLLRRLVEDDPPDETDGVRQSLTEVSSLVYYRGPLPDLQALTKKLSTVCSSDLLPPRVLEVLTQRLLYSGSQCYEVPMQTLKSAILCQEKVDAFFAEEHGLPYSLYLELRAALGQKHWGRLRLGVGYGVQLGGAEDWGGGDPEVQLCAGPERSADPEMQASATGERHAPEVRNSPANAAPEVEHVDLALGDNKAGVGYYIEVKKNPKNQQTLVQSRKKLRAILGAEKASAPGNFDTREDNRVCYQIIFYSTEKLAMVSERPEYMEKLLSKHSNWRQIIDCNDAAWELPKREIGVCIIEVKPDY